MPSPYDYLREEEERRRRALLMNAQDPVPVQTPVTPATRQRRVFGQPRPVPDSPGSQEIWKGAREAASIPIPPELHNVTRGRDLGVDAPWVRLNQAGDTVSVERFEPPISDPADALRQRRVIEKPPDPGTAGRPRFTNPITYDSSGMPERRPNNYGAEPMDTALKHREALQNWRPSGSDRSLRNIAASGGYGVMEALGTLPASATGDQAGERAIGGGIAGLLGMLFKPSTKNWLRRAGAVREADAEVAHQLKLASEQAKTRQMEMNPFFREMGLNQGQQRIDLNRDKMAQQNLLTHKRALASIFNAYPEFDPDDPKNRAIVEAMNAVGLPVTKKTRGSLLQLVQGTDAEGNATFSIVHKPSGTATRVTGEGLPTATEGQLNREAAAERTEYTQGQINERERNRARTGGLTPYQQLQRRDEANVLIAKIKSARSEAERLTKKANDEPRYRDYYLQERDKVFKEGNDAAIELNEKFGDQYEAGPGDQGWPYWKEKPRAQEDPKIRAYADRFFGGNYDAAVEAIRKQRGQ